MLTDGKELEAGNSQKANVKFTIATDDQASQASSCVVSTGWPEFADYVTNVGFYFLPPVYDTEPLAVNISMSDQVGPCEPCSL